MHVRPFELDAGPMEVLARWPAEWPLAAICFGPPPPHPRWVVLARPRRRLREAEARAALAKPLGKGAYAEDAPVFQGGMIGMVSYEVGREFEPKAKWREGRDSGWPDLVWFECPDALVFDAVRKRWWRVGEMEVPAGGRTGAAGWRASAADVRGGREAYRAGVARVLEYIRAGDVYQVNLTRRVEMRFEGSARGLFGAMLRDSDPWYGAFLEWQDEERAFAVSSQSPELFLEYEPATGMLMTRPMKGTRQAGQERDLEVSAKDRAELAMIVDLMRNDLGRVCRLGSVRVETPRAMERHGRGEGALLQTTATVMGQLKPEASAWDVLRATFPGGSVTGAPKVRAMQIIDELEPSARGPYCGAIGFVSDSGHMALNLAIRTALIEGARGDQRLSFSVGAGIVADSEPAAEFDETIAKFQGFGRTLHAKPDDARMGR